MLAQFKDFLTFEKIFVFTNFGILPFWIMLILIPDSRFTRFFLNSIIIPLVLSAAYIYIIYQNILLDEPLFEIFKLYLSLDNLYTVFASESFLLVFWLHFLAINIFLGSWVARDSVKYNMPRKFTFFPLILIYFFGPIGLVVYWFVRIFYSKKISLHD